MDFSKLLHEFAKIDSRISRSCCMDLSKLIHGFVKVVSWSRQNKLIHGVLKLLHGFVKFVLCSA